MTNPAVKRPLKATLLPSASFHVERLLLTETNYRFGSKVVVVGRNSWRLISENTNGRSATRAGHFPLVRSAAVTTEQFSR